MHTVNLKAGQPTLDDARRRLIDEMKSARQRGVRVMKLIHGWGSGGEGGVLAHGIRRSLRLRVKEGQARSIIPGDRFSMDTNETRELLQRCPEARRDPDLNRANPGITIVELT